MSQRRMFSPQIVDSDAFLEMPSTAQCLYFHLGMRADDDGFVGNPRKILRVVGGNEDDLKILLAKRFLLQFESGVVVIKHWRIHNLIRADRYHETKYLDEKGMLKVKKNGSYTEDFMNGQPDGNQRLTEVRLGKDRLGKDSNTILPEPSSETLANEFINLFKEINPTYKHLFGRKNQRDASKRLLALRSLEEWGKVVTFISSRRSDRFAPRISTPIQMEQKYADLETYAQGLKGLQNKNKIHGL